MNKVAEREITFKVEFEQEVPEGTIVTEKTKFVVPSDILHEVSPYGYSVVRNEIGQAIISLTFIERG